MFEELIDNAVNGNDELKNKVEEVMLKIIDSNAFSQALEKNIIESIKNMDFEDVLYDLIHEEDLFRPMIISAKKKLTEII